MIPTTTTIHDPSILHHQSYTQSIITPSDWSIKSIKYIIASAPSCGYLRIPILPHTSLHLADEATQLLPVAFPTRPHLLEEVLGWLHEACLPAFCEDTASESRQVVFESD